jgi:hypothetical protein
MANSVLIDIVPVLQNNPEFLGFEVLIAVICKQFSRLGYKALKSAESQRTFTRNMFAFIFGIEK